MTSSTTRVPNSAGQSELERVASGWLGEAEAPGGMKVPGGPLTGLLGTGDSAAGISIHGVSVAGAVMASLAAVNG